MNKIQHIVSKCPDCDGFGRDWPIGKDGKRVDQREIKRCKKCFGHGVIFNERVLGDVVME
jgi:DnaJ-class molecular chaperone